MMQNALKSERCCIFLFDGRIVVHLMYKNEVAEIYVSPFFSSFFVVFKIILYLACDGVDLVYWNLTVVLFQLSIFFL